MERPLRIVVPEYVMDDMAIEVRSSRRQHTAIFGRARRHEVAGYLFNIAASSRAMQGLSAPEVGDTRELDCAVCLDEFEAGDELRMMPCSHSFHERCIFRWLRTSHRCPCCRFALPSVDEQWVLDRDEEAAQARSESEATDED